MPYGGSSENAIKTLSSIHRALREGADNDTVLQLIASAKSRIQKALIHSIARPFICHTSQLDTTQPEDFGYGTPEWQVLFDAIPSTTHRYYKKDVGHNLSCYRNLQYRVLGKKVVFNQYTTDYNAVICEISNRGTRRCCFVKSTGIRCMDYGRGPVCQYHAQLVAKVPYMNDRFLTAIQNEGLKEAYKKHLSDPNRRSVESEVALMRTMLSVIVSRVEVGQDLQNLPMEQIGAMTAMCQRIVTTVDQMVAMETKMAMRLSVEQVTSLLLNVAAKLIDITTPTQEQCLKIAEVIENLPVRRLATETIQGNADYGTAVPQGQKHSAATTQYLEDGTTVNNGISLEAVKTEKEWVKDKFKPATAAYKAKMSNLEQRPE